MTIEIKVPSPGESISEVILSNWLVDDGAYVEKDQDIAEVDSDKATLSLAAEAAGIIRLKAKAGDTVEVGAVVAVIELTDEKPQTSAPAPAPKKETAPAPVETKKADAVVNEAQKAVENQDISLHISPLARKIMEVENLSEADLIEAIRHMRIGRKDIAFLKAQKDKQPATPPLQAEVPGVALSSWPGQRSEERKRMTPLRKKLSERLVSVKNETAMLTTFNEVNMSPIMELRSKYKDAFKQKHGVNLGFMSFFTKAVTEALRHFPQVNAQIDGDDILTFDYVDMSIAVSGPKGLVVPVIRNAEMLSLAEIELAIKDLATKARENKLTLEEMSGGTFTITNGGVFGSMLSTPIINPPQSAILGMHNIVERPIAVKGKVEIHPVMYVALSYDHRIIDGRESVSFLVKVKEMLENPNRMLFGGKDPAEILLDL
ncbi:MAG: 2-oxoglutarate dehydrogenase complex dihydrolipoyllysine-residue succinyltransferase [Bacteroidetes bacterium]|nr:2-oxoglutarate dehydrogenase complex dihydrolipoyllysine-residue succinyltransferase [Bacteroidota bacterium]